MSISHIPSGVSIVIAQVIEMIEVLASVDGTTPPRIGGSLASLAGTGAAALPRNRGRQHPELPDKP
jgi:hypothetical protein